MKKTAALFFTVVLMIVVLLCPALSEEVRFVTVQEWLDAKGECGDCMLLLKMPEILGLCYIPAFSYDQDKWFLSSGNCIAFFS